MGSEMCIRDSISGGVYGDGAEEGTYVKIGSLVHITIRVYRPLDLTSSTNVSFTLPFTCSSGYTSNLSCYTRLTAFPSGTTNILGVAVGNTTVLKLRLVESNGNFGFLNHSAFDSSFATVQISGTYTTAS